MRIMKKIKFTIEEFKKRLEEDPRISETYLENIELPQAFSSGNKFLKNLILEKTEISSKTDTSSKWFEFAQMIEEIKIDKESVEISYDENIEAHPPLMSQKF